MYYNAWGHKCHDAQNSKALKKQTHVALQNEINKSNVVDQLKISLNEYICCKMTDSNTHKESQILEGILWCKEEATFADGKRRKQLLLMTLNCIY